MADNKTTREMATEIVIAMINSKYLISPEEVCLAFKKIYVAVREGS